MGSKMMSSFWESFWMVLMEKRTEDIHWCGSEFHMDSEEWSMYFVNFWKAALDMMLWSSHINSIAALSGVHSSRQHIAMHPGVSCTPESFGGAVNRVDKVMSEIIRTGGRGWGFGQDRHCPS